MRVRSKRPFKQAEGTLQSATVTGVQEHRGSVTNDSATRCALAYFEQLVKSPNMVRLGGQP